MADGRYILVWGVDDPHEETNYMFLVDSETLAAGSSDAEYEDESYGRAPFEHASLCYDEAHGADVGRALYIEGDKIIEWERPSAWNDRSCFLSKSRLECTESRSCHFW